jgi:alpha-tubulin suppressor-like RCC1 family protein
MPNGVPICTGFKETFCVSDGAGGYTYIQTDLGNMLIEKEYILDVYPNLIPNVKAPALKMWGRGFCGVLGNNATTDRSSPVQTVSTGTNWKQVSLGVAHSAAIKTDGTLWLWGCNSAGQLGINSTTSRSSPVQTISQGNNWKQVSLGVAHSAAIKTDGTLWLWGYGGSGRLGNISTTTHSSPVQTVSTGTDWKQVSLGVAHSAAIKTDGTLWLWGDGVSGILGNNATTDRSSPVQTVSTGNNWKQVSLGRIHSAAVKTDGTLWIWGENDNGRLGENDGGNNINKSSPIQTVSTGNNWKQVSLGGMHSAAVKTDGTLWLWGDGSLGRLGNNATIDRSSPVQTVSTGTNWKQVSLGDCHSSAIKTDGTLWLWGAGETGRLGNDSTTDRSSPVQTVSTGTNWKQVSLGVAHSAAIQEESGW